MFSGIVTFRALISGDGISFSSCDFSSPEPGIQKIQIEGPNGREILSTVHLSSVQTEKAGTTIATSVIVAALNRLSFTYVVGIGIPQITSAQFTPLNVQAGASLAVNLCDLLYVGDSITATLGIVPDNVKANLELPSIQGEKYFGLFSSALQSNGAVEQFLHLYNLLRMFFNDRQATVDAFIIQHEPTVLQNPHPLRRGVMETVYSRLRNEYAHPRNSGGLEATKREMSQYLGGLRAITQRAISLQP